jgi:hypothetical protein
MRNKSMLFVERKQYGIAVALTHSLTHSHNTHPLNFLSVYMWIRSLAFPGQKTPGTLIHSTSHHTFATVGWIKRLSAGLLGGKRIRPYYLCQAA